MSAEGVVYLVDDDLSLREALSSLIRSAGLQVRLFASAADFLAAERVDAPGCLVLDVRLPDLSGLDLQTQLIAVGEQLPIIFITGYGDIPMSVRAMKAGAMDFLAKPLSQRELLDAIRAGLKRHASWRSQSSMHDEIHGRWKLLSPRERQVAERILSGQLNKQVAAALGLSEITVKIHRRNVLRKMKVPSLIGLVQLIGTLRMSAEPKPVR